MLSVIIWDSKTLPDNNEEIIILWKQNRQSNSTNQISIAELIEKNADRLKTRYLTWIYNLGETKFGLLNVVDALKIRNNLSYWWMTPLAEKYNFSKSPQINDAIRLMAFDEWNKSTQAKSMILVTDNIALAECLEIYCRCKNLGFVWTRSTDSRIRKSVKGKISRSLPNTAKVLIWLIRYFINRWSCRGIGVAKWKLSTAKITFFSYFDGLLFGTASESKLENYYWGDLPSVLQTAGKQTNWLYILSGDSKSPVTSSSHRLINQLNHSGNIYQNHVLLDSFLSFKVLLKTVKDWYHVQYHLKKVEKVISRSHSEDLQIWPLFKDEYKTSRGIRTVENLLYLNLFEEACALLPEQNIGVYLFEQQPWEFSLINTWKSNQHNKLIGAQHTTVLFWDLRYFADPRSFSDISSLRFPMPDKIAVNGPISMNTLSDAGYVKDDLILTEALRYQYIEEYKAKIKAKGNKQKYQVLVLGDYSFENTYHQIKLLELAIDLLNFKPRIIMRPHPSCPIHSRDFKILEITERTLPELLFEVDMVYTSGSTSGAVDAYCMGLPVVSVLAPEKLNLSPLRGIPGVNFADTPQKLAGFIQHLYESDSGASNKIEFFTMNSKLSRWRSLLEI
jgi:surface carbohydrate biosynthesis protein (TIGR04326 family)